MRRSACGSLAFSCVIIHYCPDCGLSRSFWRTPAPLPPLLARHGKNRIHIPIPANRRRLPDGHDRAMVSNSLLYIQKERDTNATTACGGPSLSILPNFAHFIWVMWLIGFESFAQRRLESRVLFVYQIFVRISNKIRRPLARMCIVLAPFCRKS